MQTSVSESLIFYLKHKANNIFRQDHESNKSETSFVFSNFSDLTQPFDSIKSVTSIQNMRRL